MNLKTAVLGAGQMGRRQALVTMSRIAAIDGDVETVQSTAAHV